MGKTSVVILLLRTVAGILFFFQGYDKLFKIKVPNVIQTFSESYRRIFPPFVLSAVVYLSSFVELVAGLLLFLGIYKLIALYALCVDLFFVALVFTMLRPMWDMKFFLPRLLLVCVLLLLNDFNDPFSISALLK